MNRTLVSAGVGFARQKMGEHPVYLFAPTYTPKMIASSQPKMVASHQPQMSGISQPAMAPAIKLRHVSPIHGAEHKHLRAPLAKPLTTVPFEPKPSPPIPMPDRAAPIEHRPPMPLIPREPLWR